MWKWLFGRRGPEPEPPIVPSELGDHLHLLMTLHKDEWVASGSECVRHEPTNIHISNTYNICWFYNDWNRIDPSIDRGVYWRLVSIAVELIRDVHAATAIKTIVKHTHLVDPTAALLAHAVLKGDKVAALALADRVQELAQEGHL